MGAEVTFGGYGYCLGRGDGGLDWNGEVGGGICLCYLRFIFGFNIY